MTLLLLSASTLGPSLVCMAQEFTFTAWSEVTPVIDGRIDSGEWDDAAQHTQGNVTVWVKNDGVRLFIAVLVRDATFRPAHEGGGQFTGIIDFNGDNDTDLRAEPGDDVWFIGLSTRFVGDYYVAHDLVRRQDSGDGGTTDIQVAYQHSNPIVEERGDYTFEFQGLLDSADDAHDFSLMSGDSIGFRFSTIDGRFPPASAFAQITVAAPPEPEGCILDQELDSEIDVDQPLWLPVRQAQVFTVGMNGNLCAFEVFLLKPDRGVPRDVTWEVRPAQGGTPGDVILAAGAVRYDDIPVGPSWIRIDIEPGLRVQPGDQLAIVLRPTAFESEVSTSWWGRTGDVYAGGSAFFKVATDPWVLREGGVDWMFRTYVDPRVISPDTDSDGLTDADEIALGTDPNKPDTDGDGLLDGTEVEMAIANGTNCPDPLSPDSDGDGLTDGAEVGYEGVEGTGTDPCNPDTDGDGLNDLVDPTPLQPGAPP
ncbi:MAG: hypothetical protein KJZ68_05455, partial [Phycisphaerales bacterium]|nr:hypothetical protein [Phycisphaerales bacterium]